VRRFERSGPGGELDCLIAAQALALKLPLVSNKASEFECIPGLVLENWAEEC
jgi:tRNA(fMet)-specific endonuclease VapC